LEEPPSYVIFILATTEANKLPITILSRCQRYDFKRISIDTISDRLNELMKTEQVTVEEKAIRYIAKAADGSMRDALSLLDQCIAFHLGEELTYDRVLEVLGAVDTDVFAGLLQCILQQDVLHAVGMIEELVVQGRELGQFVIDFTWYLRNLLLLQSSDDMEDVLGISSENLVKIKEIATQVEPEQLMRYIHIFSELTNQIRYATQKRILIEVTVIKLCKPQMETNYEALTDRVTRLEQQIEQGIAAVPANHDAAVRTMPEAPKKKPELAKAVPDEVRQAIARWEQIVRQLGNLSQRHLKHAVKTLGANNELLIIFDDGFSADYMMQDETRKQELEEAIANVIERQVEVVFQKNETGQPAANVVPDLSGMFGMEVEIEE
jgi:DNA polymerase-3 subunit gamma/tau